MVKLIKSLLTDDSGASAAEYALILAIVGTAIAGASIFLGNTIATAMNDSADCISSAGTDCAG
jgi:pilus assembly protein Flp/PilA